MMIFFTFLTFYSAYFEKVTDCGCFGDALKLRPWDSFYKDVVIKYDNKTITCDKLDLMISENIALAYSNVVVKDDKSIMKAQIITLDIITKDININSEDKINIVTNN